MSAAGSAVPGLAVGTAVLYLTIVVLIPLAAITVQATEGGWSNFWSAVTALINQGRLRSGKGRVGFANPALYALGRSKPGVFHDITGGNNLFYSAGPGWDFVTGWGTPDVAKLYAAWP